MATQGEGPRPWLHDGIAAKGGGHEDDGGIRARPVHGFLHGVEHGNALNAGSALARVTPATTFGAVGDGLLGVKHSLAPVMLAQPGAYFH